MAVELCTGLGKILERTLPATLLYDYPTVELLSGYLSRSVLGLEEAPVNNPARHIASIRGNGRVGSD